MTMMKAFWLSSISLLSACGGSGSNTPPESTTVAPISTTCTNDNLQKMTWITDSSWAVYQDGPTGTWTKLVASNGQYVFCVTNAQGRFALANMSTNSTTKLLEISYLNKSDLPDTIVDEATKTAKSITATITGTTDGQFGFLSTETSEYSTYNWSNPFFTSIEMQSVLPKTSDLIANIWSVDANSNLITTRYYLERGVDFTSITNKTIDFLSTLSFDAAIANTLTLEGTDSTITDLIIG